jgi:ketosteroid isomerase-like protein
MDRGKLVDRVQRMYAAFAAGDTDQYRTAFADDIVWHVPGDNPVSGAYRGHQEYFRTMVERMNPLDEWAITVKEILTNQNDSAALVAFHLSGSRKGKQVDMGGYHMIRLNEEGRIAEGWGFVEDQDVLDDFFSA